MIVNSNKVREDIISIPQEMKSLTSWCGFYNDSNGELDKKPISILTKRGGLKSDSSDKLVSYDKAIATLNEGKIAAIGFGLSPATGIICIDIDCHKPELQSKYEELKTLLLSKFRSYAETSISGTGTHIYIRGTIPEGYKNKDSLGLIEIFDSRFVVTTGDIIPNRASDILEEQDSLDWLCETYLQKSNLRTLGIIQQGTSTKTDEEIIAKIISISKGSCFMSGEYQQIMKNGTPAYASKSEADLAFCNQILYYNGNDIEQAKRIFLASGMSKDLENKSSGYLQTQLTYASTTLQSTYDWNKSTEIQEEVDLDTKNKEFIARVAEQGFNVTDNSKLNNFCTKYLLNFGYQSSLEVVDTTLLDLDSLSNGKRFYFIMKSDLLYNSTSNEWAKWDEKKWSRCYDSDLLGATQKVFDNLKHEAFQLVLSSIYEIDTDKKKKLEQQALELFQYASTNKSKRACTEMIDFAKSHFDPKEYQKLECPRNALNLSNGIFDFDTMQFVSHSKEYYQTMISSAIYDPQATCPTWINTLERIVPDAVIRHYIQKAVGYTLSSKYSEKALFILHGSGNNGKTTFINVILKLMGEYSVVVSPQTIMENHANQNNGPRPDLIRLRDKRFAAVSESNENDKLSEGIIKSLTGAGYISCRTLHKEPIEFKAMGKYWFDTNHKPTVKGTDTAIWSRLKVIPFEVQIPKSEIDTSLGEKLERELSGILNWGIEGYRLYINEGLIEPEKIKLVMSEYAEDMSAMDQWIKECIEIKVDSLEIKKTSVNSKELYQSYKNWCAHNGEYSWSQRKFTSELNKKDFSKMTKTVNGIVRYKLIKLNPLGLLCYQKDNLYSGDFNSKYSECIRALFKQQSMIDKKLSALGYDKHTNTPSSNIIPINPSSVSFGQL